jgi:hypothetical protein
MIKTDIASSIIKITQNILPGEIPALIFANKAYSQVLDNWLAHAETVGFNHVMVVSLDEEIHADLKMRGVRSILAAQDGSLAELWMLRAHWFSFLCRSGVDFIHTDADAVWLKNPVDYCFDLPADVILSQGTIWPPDVLQSWGFVLCCGFFAVRACQAAQHLFEKVAYRTAIEGDDQLALNRILMEGRVKWHTDGVSRELKMYSKLQYAIFDEPVFGQMGDLRLALLPYKKFQRIPLQFSEAPVIVHPLSLKKGHSKKEILSACGAWRLSH